KRDRQSERESNSLSRSLTHTPTHTHTHTHTHTPSHILPRTLLVRHFTPHARSLMAAVAAAAAAAAASSSSQLLILNRVAGVITSGPSFMTGVNIINSVAASYRGSFLQGAVLVSTSVSLVVDMLMLVTLSAWIADQTIWWFSRAVVTISILKRAHSVVTVHVTFIRFQAVTGLFHSSSSTSRAARSRWAVGGLVSSPAALTFTGVYLLLSAFVAAAHFLSYYNAAWSSADARSSDTFKYYYRISNLVATSYYVFFGLYVDYQFIRLGDRNPLSRERFRRLRSFYNHWIYLAYELLLYLGFLTAIFWDISNQDVVSSIYIEQCLLSFMLFNGICLVQAVSSTDSNPAASANDPAPRAGAAVGFSSGDPNFQPYAAGYYSSSASVPGTPVKSHSGYFAYPPTSVSKTSPQLPQQQPLSPPPFIPSSGFGGGGAGGAVPASPPGTGSSGSSTATGYGPYGKPSPVNF
ncbi:hypothetical protein DFJ73DRAFT_932642, partial [Zopfochytrium polystomum]